MLPPWFCKIVYRVWPPVLRILETCHAHHVRQDFLIGCLDPAKTADQLLGYLESQGYEKAILAWKDPGEALSLRKIDRDVFQYHLRLFADGELRGHYEYSSEGKPLLHCLSTIFTAEKEYFKQLLANYLKTVE